MTDRTVTLAADGKDFAYPLLEGSVGPDVVDIRKMYAQTGMFTYDPGFTSTASCQSAITYIDGDQGILLHRGYPIDQLAEQSSFMEVAYLLLHGDLPSKAELDEFNYTITRHTMVHEQLATFFRGFRRDAHPMAIMCGVVGALSAFYHDSAAALVVDGLFGFTRQHTYQEPPGPKKCWGAEVGIVNACQPPLQRDYAMPRIDFIANPFGGNIQRIWNLDNYREFLTGDSVYRSIVARTRSTASTRRPCSPASPKARRRRHRGDPRLCHGLRRPHRPAGDREQRMDAAVRCPVRITNKPGLTHRSV